MLNFQIIVLFVVLECAKTKGTINIKKRKTKQEMTLKRFARVENFIDHTDI
jgi:hypothetical protein